MGRSIGDQVRGAVLATAERRRAEHSARTEVEALEALAGVLSDEGASLLRRMLR